MRKLVLSHYIKKRIKNSEFYLRALLLGVGYEDITDNFHCTIDKRTKLYQAGVHEILYLTKLELMVLIGDFRLLEANRLTCSPDTLIVLKDYAENDIVTLGSYLCDRKYTYYFDIEPSSISNIYIDKYWFYFRFSDMYLYDKKSLYALSPLLKDKHTFVCFLFFDSTLTELLHEYFSRTGLFDGSNTQITFHIYVKNQMEDLMNVKIMCEELSSRYGHGVYYSDIHFQIILEEDEYFDCRGFYVALGSTFSVTAIPVKNMAQAYAVNYFDELISGAIEI